MAIPKRNFDWDDLFDFFESRGVSRKLVPAIDVYETETDIVVKCAVAGVKPEDIEVTVGDDYVEIKGKREARGEEKSRNHLRQELSYGAFSRDIQLPELIDKEKADSEIDHGILTVTIPKLKPGKEEGVKKIRPKIK